MIRGLFNLLKHRSLRKEWRFLALVKTSRWLMPDYHLAWPQIGWWYDEAFNNYLKRFGEFSGFNSDRRWMIGQLTKLARHVPGDTAECGVLAGSSSYLICQAFRDRMHFVFDSFEGLSKPGSFDGNCWQERHLTCDLKTAQENLRDCPNVSFHKGWIPERFSDVKSRRFCFVHIDVQLYEPTRDSLQFFYPRMSDGGVIVCDDYGFTTCPGATRAVDEFLRDKPEQVIGLSCGSAFFIKQPADG